MRILINSLPDLKKINLQRYHHIINYLSKKHDITIICVNAWWLDPIEDSLVYQYLSNTDFHYISKQKFHPSLQELLTLKKIKTLKLDPSSFDVCINFHSLISGFEMSKYKSLPKVFDLCDDIVDWVSQSAQIPLFFKPAGKYFARSLLTYNLKRADHVTYSLDFLKQKFRIKDDKSSLIPNGVNTILFYKSSGRLKKIPENSNNHFVLGFVGYLGDWIEFEPVFEALKKVKESFNISLLIVGQGPKLSYYKKMVSQNNLEDRVIFTGNVPYQDVPRLIESMNVCLLPFDNSSVSQNALPLKLFEYMICEKPVLSSSFLQGVKQMIGTNISYYSNVDDLVELITLYHQNPILSEEVGIKGREFVENNYNWDSICSKFEKILINVSNRGNIE